MTIQCPKCTKCKTCKEIRKINEFMEQQVLDQLVKFVDGEDGKPGYFTSPLPLKPFDINSVRGNRCLADEQNKKMLIKLKEDPQALKQVKDEMEKLQEANSRHRRIKRSLSQFSSSTKKETTILKLTITSMLVDRATKLL